jgi:putative transcriptional regulator
LRKIHLGKSLKCQRIVKYLKAVSVSGGGFDPYQTRFLKEREKSGTGLPAWRSPGPRGRENRNFYIPAMAYDANPETRFDPDEHIARLKPGVLLLARDMADANFTATVLLVCQHGPEGSYGLVLNRVSHMPISEVFDNPPAWAGEVGPKRKIFIGGPVQPEELQILQVTGTPVPGSYRVAPEVYLGGYWNDVKEILELDPRTVRLFLGYAGWGADQLPGEIQAQAWEVWDVNIKKLLMGPDEAWLGGMTQLKSFLSTL